jgi:ribosome-binding factor A
VSKGNRSKPAPPRGKGPRTARLGELLREVVAEELERIDDPRLELVSITSVEVDADLNRAIVSYDSVAGEAGDAEILEAFAARRVRLQAAVGRQIHARKTPVLQFRPDEVIRHAERIEQILRDTPRDGGPAAGPGPDEAGPGADATGTDADVGPGSAAETDAGPA